MRLATSASLCTQETVHLQVCTSGVAFLDVSQFRNWYLIIGCTTYCGPVKWVLAFRDWQFPDFGRCRFVGQAMFWRQYVAQCHHKGLKHSEKYLGLSSRHKQIEVRKKFKQWWDCLGINKLRKVGYCLYVLTRTLARHMQALCLTVGPGCVIAYMTWSEGFCW